jgi:hypothetical protein
MVQRARSAARRFQAARVWRRSNLSDRFDSGHEVEVDPFLPSHSPVHHLFEDTLNCDLTWWKRLNVMRHIDLLRLVILALQDVTKPSERRIGGKNSWIDSQSPEEENEARRDKLSHMRCLQ